jgi:Tfp pilus assembly protein PilE
MLRYFNPTYYLHTHQRGSQRAGYTIDQTILIVVIISILITLVITTIGWQLINRTSGTKLGSQLSEMETAVSQYYSANKAFPHQVFGTLATSSITSEMLMRVLKGVNVTNMVAPYNTANNRTDLLSGFKLVGDEVKTQNDKVVTMINVTSLNNWVAGSTASWLAVQVKDVPLPEAQEADRVIDFTESATAGRLVYTADTSDCIPTTSGVAPTVTAPGANAAKVTVCYAASPLK